MDLSFYPLTLEAIDRSPGSSVEALCLFIGEDERPLTGLAGLADWRLSGRLSRLLRQGVLTGVAGEAVLTPPGTRLGFRKLFVFGLGKLEQAEGALVERLGEGLRKLLQAGVQETALQLPARLPLDVGIRTLIDELQGTTRALVFGPDPQKLVAALSKAASGAAQLERRVVKVPAPQKPPLPVAKARPPPSQPLPIPKASPLPFAPSGSPAPEFTPAPPVPIPPAAPPAAVEPPPVAAEPKPALKPAPPPAQRFIPPEPKPHVFESGKGKGKKRR